MIDPLHILIINSIYLIITGIGMDVSFLLVCFDYDIKGEFLILFTARVIADLRFYLFFQFFSMNLQLFDLPRHSPEL